MIRLEQYLFYGIRVPLTKMADLGYDDDYFEKHRGKDASCKYYHVDGLDMVFSLNAGVCYVGQVIQPGHRFQNVVLTTQLDSIRLDFNSELNVKKLLTEFKFNDVAMYWLLSIYD